MTEEPTEIQPPPIQEEIDYKDKYLRLLADSDNLRKRMQKEKQESLKFGIENILVELLPPLDNFENALNFADQMSAEVKNWALGFQMILGQFREILSQNGVTSFVSEGEMFDPAKHEAVEMEENTHAIEAVEMEENTHAIEGTILKEFVKGYRCGDRVIRPARVKVAKKLTQGETNHDNPKEEK
jgi:molecular chaperone GrpE